MGCLDAAVYLNNTYIQSKHQLVIPIILGSQAMRSFMQKADISEVHSVGRLSSKIMVIPTKMVSTNE